VFLRDYDGQVALDWANENNQTELRYLMKQPSRKVMLAPLSVRQIKRIGIHSHFKLLLDKDLFVEIYFMLEGFSFLT
jgi:hypothetical protein